MNSLDHLVPLIDNGGQRSYFKSRFDCYINIDYIYTMILIAIPKKTAVAQLFGCYTLLGA